MPRTLGDVRQKGGIMIMLATARRLARNTPLHYPVQQPTPRIGMT